jgi:hypothetical protein
MPNDIRYGVVKILIEGGHITTLDQIFIYIPRSCVAKDYGSNYSRFARKLRNPSTFRLKDIKILAGLFEIEFNKMIGLFLHTIDNRRNNGSTQKEHILKVTGNKS